MLNKSNLAFLKVTQVSCFVQDARYPFAIMLAWLAGILWMWIEGSTKYETAFVVI